MKKLLVGAAAVALVAIASPVQAQGIDLDLGGYLKGYGVFIDQDDDSSGAGNSRAFDILRNTEIFVSGETTLDNSLTVGFHSEMMADGNNTDGFEVQESYAYFQGGWGRANVGAEDGAAYLLQVAVPSADSNLDGIRQFVSPVNYIAAGGTNTARLSVVSGGALGRRGIDYDQDLSGVADKITYFSPIFSGIQLAASYTPDTADASTEDAINLDDVNDVLGEAYDFAARYEGMFNEVGITLGAGFTHVELEADSTPAAGIDDDRQAWNVGIDLDIGPFGIGAAYLEDNYGDSTPGAGSIGGSLEDEEWTMVVGVDYTTGPFKFGASYLDMENTADIAGANGTGGIETERYTGGVVYTYGPGMTFRGSISHIQHDNVAGLLDGGDEIEATSVLLGTQINF